MSNLVKKSDLADLGKSMITEANANLLKQAESRLVKIAEHVMSRVIHHEMQIDTHKRMVDLYKRKKKAIENGDFSVNRHDMTITFNEKELNDLG